MSQKKTIRIAIIEKLSASLADYRSLVGEKKFDRRIRKTAKTFGEDIAKAMPKKLKKNNDKEIVAALKQIV